MAGSTIRAKVTIGVTLGTTSGPGVYFSPLTITPTGNISPSAYSATGLVAGISAGYVLNEGTITGGVAIAAGSFNEPGHLGGTGVTLTAGASLTNDGEIAGGAGSQGYPGGDGGGGVYLAAGSSLTNHGAIAGGDGGHDSYQQPGGFLVVGGDGGSGVTLAAGSLTNDGTIVGGGGASGLDAYGVGGDGVILVSGSLANDGVIAGGVGGYFLTGRGRSGTGVTVASGTLTNDGTIVGGYFGGAGVALASGTLTNDAVIGGGSGGGTGITLAGGILANGGTIAGGDGGGIGVDLAAGSLTNNGTIGGGAGTNGSGSNGLGGSGGAGVDLPAGSLINNGTIVGGTGGYGSLRPGDGGGGIALGMQPAIGGTLTNDGTIIGGAGGPGGGGRAYGISTAYGGIGVLLSVLLTSGGTLTNDGAIVGGAGGTGDGVGGMGVRFDTTGMLTNHGTIIGGGAASNGGVGVLLNSGGTLTNDGTIVGGGGSIGAIGVQINFAGTLTNAGFIGGGASDGGRADAVYFGRYFDSTASRLILDPGASFGGAVVANPSFSNVMELATGDGTGTIAGLGDTITGFAAIQFDADAAWVIEGSAAGLATGQTIAGFAAGDTIELAGVTAIGSIYSSGTLTLMQTSGSVQLHFPDLPESVTAASFIVHNAAAGVDVSLAAPCFAAGTRILTTRGAVAVEALQIGDLVPVLMGSGVEPIVWLGFRHVDCTRHPHPEDVWPVRLSRGAFGPGQPSRDLWLSPDHAVFINGVLIPIRYLVNGRTIRQEPRDTISYWHVELTRHDVLYAEGVLAETYLDTSNRKNFSNGYGPVALHADFAPRVWEAEGCAPLVVTGPILDATRQRLNNRAGAMRYTMAAPGRRRTPARNA